MKFGLEIRLFKGYVAIFVHAAAFCEMIDCQIIATNLIKASRYFFRMVSCGQLLQGKRSRESNWKFFAKKSPKISFGLKQIVELGSGKFNPHVQPNQAVPNFCKKCIIFSAINMELRAPIIIEAD